MRGKFGEEFDPLFKWNGKIVAEENLNSGFNHLIEDNIEGFDIIGFDLGIFQGEIISGRLHLKKGIKRTVYKKLKDDLSLKDIFYSFQNTKIEMKIGYNLNFGQKG